jgi:hypothetical protein
MDSMENKERLLGYFDDPNNWHNTSVTVSPDTSNEIIVTAEEMRLIIKFIDYIRHNPIEKEET